MSFLIIIFFHLLVANSFFSQSSKGTFYEILQATDFQCNETNIEQGQCQILDYIPFSSNLPYQCVRKCNQISNCNLFTIISSNCSFYSSNDIDFDLLKINRTDSVIYQKVKPKETKSGGYLITKVYINDSCTFNQECSPQLGLYCFQNLCTYNRITLIKLML